MIGRIKNSMQSQFRFSSLLESPRLAKGEMRKIVTFLCPRRMSWTLPENEGNKSGLYNNSYGNLLYKEGVINTQTGGGYTTGGFQKLSSPPLSFVRSGYHPTPGATLDYRGSRGYYWSRSASGANSLFLYFLSSSIGPQFSFNKSDGVSLRCVAW